MPKFNSLAKILARARSDARKAVNPVKQSKAKALTDNPDWQAQYLAEFDKIYTNKISSQNDTERKNDSIKKQILIARNAKAAAAHSAKSGFIISDDDIKNDAQQKYGEDAEIYIQNYKDEYQRIWDGTTPEKQIQFKAKINGARLAREGRSIDEKQLAQSAEQYDQFAELYIQTYKAAYHEIFDNMTPEQKVTTKAKINGAHAAREGSLIDENKLVQSLVQSAEQYDQFVELYIQTYKDAYHAIFDNMTPEQKVTAKAKINGAQAARNASLIDEEHLVQSAKQHNKLADLYIQTYKAAYHEIFDNMTTEQKVKARAKMNGAQIAYNNSSIDEGKLMKSAKQYNEFADLYIQTYKAAYQKIFDKMTPEQKVKASAKTKANNLVAKGYYSVNEEWLATTATQYGEFAELYAKNYKNFHQAFVNKKRPLPENTQHSKRQKLA